MLELTVPTGVVGADVVTTPDCTTEDDATPADWSDFPAEQPVMISNVDAIAASIRRVFANPDADPDADRRPDARERAGTRLGRTTGENGLTSALSALRHHMLSNMWRTWSAVNRHSATLAQTGDDSH